MPLNIKEANKKTKIYVEKPLTLHIFCFMHELHNRNASFG